MYLKSTYSFELGLSNLMALQFAYTVAIKVAFITVAKKKLLAKTTELIGISGHAKSEYA